MDQDDVDPPDRSEATFDLGRIEKSFAANDAGAISIGDLKRLRHGEITGEQLLRERLRKRGEPPPSSEDIAAFDQALAEQQQEHKNVMAEVVASMPALPDMRKALGLDLAEKLPFFSVGKLNSIMALPELAKIHVDPPPYIKVDAPPMINVGAAPGIKVSRDASSKLVDSSSAMQASLGPSPMVVQQRIMTESLKQLVDLTETSLAEQRTTALDQKAEAARQMKATRVNTLLVAIFGTLTVLAAVLVPLLHH